MSKRPSVSVVIPSFNRSGLVREAIRSVLDQSVQPSEVVVVDHGSTDETADVIRSFGNDVKALKMGDFGRGGPAVPRNAGIFASSGEWIAFLDDDDAWRPDKLLTQLQALNGKKEPLLVSTDASVIDEAGNQISDRYLPEGCGTSGDVFNALVAENCIIASSVLVKRRALLDAGGFDERTVLHRVEDYHLWLRLAARGGFLHVDEPLVVYRRHHSPSGKRSMRAALKHRRTALRLALEDREVRGRAMAVRLGIARDYGKSLKLAMSPVRCVP